MTTLIENPAARPWYREPWPWLLMAGPCAVVIAGFVTLWLAIKSNDGLVADDYYKRGLAINLTLARAQRAVQLGLRASVTLDAELRRVRVTLSGGMSLPDELRLRLVHPTRTVADELIVLSRVAPGVYAGKLAAAAGGRRVVMLEDAARTWRLAAESSGDARTVELTPQ